MSAFPSSSSHGVLEQDSFVSSPQQNGSGSEQLSIRHIDDIKAASKDLLSKFHSTRTVLQYKIIQYYFVPSAEEFEKTIVVIAALIKETSFV